MGRSIARSMLRRFFLLQICLIGSLMGVLSQQPQGAVPLWPEGKVPGARGTDPEKDVPTLTPFWPAAENATGAAMIVCPGGGCRRLADHEGKDYAIWLAERGALPVSF